MGRGKHEGRRDQRPHRPHELGPRVFRRGRWWAADLRPWDGGRTTLRNPTARGWPNRGRRTEDEEVARRWAWAYVDLHRDQRKRSALGLEEHTRPLGPLRDEWTRWRELQGKAQKTIEGGITATGHLMDHLGPGFPVEDVADELDDFFVSFMEAGYAPSTLDTMRRQLSSFFEWAKLQPNPAKGVELPFYDRGEARAWRPDELVRIRHVADEMDLRLPVELALGTGARQCELWALEGGDFSEANRTVFIRRQLARDGSRTKRLKGKRHRTAVVLPFVWDHLPSAGGLLLHDQGEAVKPRASRDTLKEVLEEAGVYEPGVGWHRFRHTYGRLFLEAGGWMDELQRSLGHASIRTTELLYGHFAPDQAAGYAVSRIYGQGRHLRIVE